MDIWPIIPTDRATMELFAPGDDPKKYKMFSDKPYVPDEKDEKTSASNNVVDDSTFATSSSNTNTDDNRDVEQQKIESDSSDPSTSANIVAE